MPYDGTQSNLQSFINDAPTNGNGAGSPDGTGYYPNTLTDFGLESEFYDKAFSWEPKYQHKFILKITDIPAFLIKTYPKDSIKKETPHIGNGIVNKKIRDTERVMLPQIVGIGATLTATGFSANNYWWKYNITHANQTEFLIYKPDGHYNPHVDTFHIHSDETRKLTVLAFLNDDYEGGKFFLNSKGEVFYPKQDKGTVLVFPSYMVHGVEPVTKGVRYSCVTWLVGPYFK